jgi:hypothetical protein
MTRRFFYTLMLAWLAALVMVIPALAAKSYYAERFDVQIELQKGGSAIVTETVEFRFSGDPFTFAFREISARETDGITFLDASMDGTPMPLGMQAGQAEVGLGDPVKVTWHFAPTSETAHVFTVRYRAEGIIRKGAADTFIWRAVPQDHDYQIKSSRVTLIYPSATEPLEPPTLNRGYEWSTGTRGLVLTTNGLGEDEDVILIAKFPADSLSTSASRWQARMDQRNSAVSKALPIGVFSALAALVLGGLGLLALGRAGERDLSIPPVVSSANPPGEVPPAIVGKLTRQEGSFMGTVFDLAQRGILEVEEKKGFLGTTRHMLRLKDGAQILKPHEQGLLNALFSPAKTEINLSDIGMRIETGKKLFEAPLEQELLQRGWIDPERKKRRFQIQIAGFTLTWAAFIALLISMSGISSSLDNGAGLLPWIAAGAGLSFAALILSILVLIFGSSYSILTPAGEEQSARWKGFSQYLKDVSKGRESATRADYFERYLAYAVIFGLGTKWARYFQELGGVSLPAWFHAAAGSRGDFGAIVAVMSAGDSSGAGSAGGAGASGGGSSGAG